MGSVKEYGRFTTFWIEEDGVEYGIRPDADGNWIMFRRRPGEKWRILAFNIPREVVEEMIKDTEDMV